MTFVLRGLVDDSMQRTAERLAALLGAEGAEGTPSAGKPAPGLVIDPTLYQRFGVDRIPVFVLPLERVPPCASQGCPTPEHVKLAGDVGLDYALDVMARDAKSTAARRAARAWRDRLGPRE